MIMLDLLHRCVQRRLPGRGGRLSAGGPRVLVAFEESRSPARLSERSRFIFGLLGLAEEQEESEEEEAQGVLEAGEPRSPSGPSHL